MERTLLEKFAWWMDEMFVVPGTRVRVGWDPLLDLVPGIGDALTTVLQAAVVLVTAAQYPWLPRALVARMMLNVILDALISAVPGIGNVGDVFFRANTMNARLLRAALEQRDARGRPATARHVLFLVAMGVAFVALLAGIVAGTFLALRWIWGFVTSPGTTRW